MSGRRRNTKQEEASGANWLCTFNDLMTNLMVFFLLLFSMGSIDLDKSSGMIGSLQSGLGVLEAGDSVEIAVVDPQPSIEALENDIGNMSEVYNEILADLAYTEKKAVNGEEIGRAINYLPYKNLGKIENIPGVNAQYTPEGILITLEDRLLFEIGQAEIHPEAYPVLEHIVKAIRATGYQVRIEGHTDDIPIHTNRYASNWELSIDRAIHVLKYFIENGSINPTRLSAVGYGDVKPLVENNTAEQRSKNRRVEIVLYIGGITADEQ